MTRSAGSSSDSKMQRNGSYLRVVVFVLFVFGAAYLMYLYNASLGRLREAEADAERYRREGETRVAQLQEVIHSKDEQGKQFSLEKQAMSGNMASLSQQFEQLKNQHGQLHDHNKKQQQELNLLREEYSQKEAQHNMEFQKHKQEHDYEVSELREQLAGSEQKKQELQREIQGLKIQVQQGLQQLSDTEDQLHEQQQLTQHLQEQIQHFESAPQGQKALNLNSRSHQQQQPFPGWNVGHQRPVSNMRIENIDDARHAGLGGDKHAQTGEQQGVPSINQAQQQQHDGGLNNDHHQILPPGNKEQQPGPEKLQEDVAQPADQKEEEDKEEDVYNNHHQVMAPDLGDNVNKDQQAKENVAADEDAGGLDNMEHRELEHPQNEHLGILHDLDQDLGHLQNEDPLGMHQRDPQMRNEDDMKEDENEDLMRGRLPANRGQWDGNPAEEEEEEEDRGGIDPDNVIVDNGEEEEEQKQDNGDNFADDNNEEEDNGKDNVNINDDNGGDRDDDYK